MGSQLCACVESVDNELAPIQQDEHHLFRYKDVAHASTKEPRKERDIYMLC